MKKVAVVLSGCGHRDGAEITESVSTLVSLSEMGAKYEIFAPDLKVPATDHLTGSTGEARSSLHEAARIARGHIKNIKDLKPTDFDALVFPGGYGAATVLCGFGKSGAKCDVDPQVQRVIEGFYEKQKPIAAICIAPALIARVLGNKGVTVTIGEDRETAAEIEKTGAHHKNCGVEDHITDKKNRIVTTPAYMYDEAKPHQVFKGIRGAVQALLQM
jgi:enhancing lycopene biosynthesis protein 2